MNESVMKLQQSAGGGESPECIAHRCRDWLRGMYHTANQEVDSSVSDVSHHNVLHLLNSQGKILFLQVRVSQHCTQTYQGADQSFYEIKRRW